MRKIVIITIVVLFASCCNKKNEKTSVFSNYLEETLGMKIPAGQHYFVILLQSVCRGGVYASQIYLNAYLEKNPSLADRITFIYSNQEMVNHDLLRKLNALYDDEEKIDRLPATMGIGNLTIFSTVEGRIKNQTVINDNNFEEINTFMPPEGTQE